MFSFKIKAIAIGVLTAFIGGYIWFLSSTKENLVIENQGLERDKIVLEQNIDTKVIEKKFQDIVVDAKEQRHEKKIEETKEFKEFIDTNIGKHRIEF